MQNFAAIPSRLGVWVGSLLMLVGCAVQFAPTYDEALLNGLTSANADTMELLASAAGGTRRETFPTREAAYNRVIGHLDALELQANARPVPRNNVSDAVKKLFSSGNSEGSPSQVIPSTTAIHEISNTVLKMRDADKKRGVNGLEVQAFKNQVLTFMDQALTYEAALKR